MKKIIFIVMGLLILSSTSNASYIRVSTGRSIDRSYVPQVRLIRPTGEKVSLQGQDSLEFVWSRHEGRRLGGSRYYDFRLYKGLDMVQATLMLKERVPGNTRSISISADTFENGGTYTWSIRLVYKGIGKSDRSFSSFTVKK